MLDNLSFARRPLKLKEGQEKPKTKAPKIQRLVTPLVLQRARRVKALKRARIAKAKSDANDYAKLLALRQKVKASKHSCLLPWFARVDCITLPRLLLLYVTHRIYFAEKI